MAKFSINPKSTRIVPQGFYQWSCLVARDASGKDAVRINGSVHQEECASMAEVAAALLAHARELQGWPRAAIARGEFWN
ncbi:hypothetical protein ABT282_08395 [Streptomyces sp. NPDC000927]|uniref:hypothetical protein n=1 Tax=Streptomyces sp. NPDC000927 TaxID=3154371 RepID=UPI00332D4E5A